MAAHEDWLLYERYFSPERLAPYLAESNNDNDLAMALYRWDADARAAFLPPFGHLEVAVRNTLDQQMTARQHRLGQHRHWVFDDAHQLGRDGGGPGRNVPPYVEIAAAMRHVLGNQKPLDAAQVISELPFGFWHQLVSKRQNFLWPDLVGGFPFAPNRSALSVRDIFARLRLLRNRIGHHHRVGGGNLAGRYDDILTLAGYIDPDLRDWIDSHSSVTSVISIRPRNDQVKGMVP